MKPSEILKKIETLLSGTVKLETMTLDNGTVIEADSFEAGVSVFVVSGEERVALPVGEYTLEDGRMITVEEEGIIAMIGDAPQTEPAPVQAEKEPVYATKEEVDEIKALLAEIKSSLQLQSEKEESLLSEVQKLSAELEKPAAEPFKHSPEKGGEKTLKLGSESIVEFLNNRKK